MLLLICGPMVMVILCSMPEHVRRMLALPVNPRDANKEDVDVM